jgi:hypothetical protein
MIKEKKIIREILVLQNIILKQLILKNQTY